MKTLTPSELLAKTVEAEKALFFLADQAFDTGVSPSRLGESMATVQDVRKYLKAHHPELRGRGCIYSA